MSQLNVTDKHILDFSIIECKQNRYRNQNRNSVSFLRSYVAFHMENLDSSEAKHLGGRQTGKVEPNEGFLGLAALHGATLSATMLNFYLSCSSCFHHKTNSSGRRDKDRPAFPVLRLRSGRLF